MYSSSINISYISLEPFLLFKIKSMKDGLQGRGVTPSILRSSGQVDRTASLIPWNVVNGGVKLYFCWKSYQVMKSPLSVKRSWISIIPESYHFLMKMGLLSILMKQLCQRGDFKTDEILRFGIRVTKSHNECRTSFQNGFEISFSLLLKYSFPKSHTDFIEHLVASLKRFTHEELVCRILRIHVSFRALTNDGICIMRHPAFLWSWHIIFLAIRSTLPLHINCAKSLSNWVIISEEGFGKLINRWVTFDSSSVLITVILPKGVRFLLDQWLISFLIVFILLS